MHNLLFATSNDNKVREMKSCLEAEGLDFSVEKLDFDFLEPQLDSIAEIAKHKAEAACNQAGRTVIAEDTGVEINALDDFPGPYSKWIFYKIKPQGFLDLLKNKEDRSAVFKTVIALAIPGEETRLFVGDMPGSISEAIRGSESGSWGYDPIFVPEGSDKTYAEDYSAKLQDSHRIRALRKLVTYFKSI